ncbi:MAG: GNAT family N-acetyltransferase [Gammaproteobacteria bacterium]|nr:MAG: GNAT family N-acetyltransferase [Gammaproteobacteria bacterium]
MITIRKAIPSDTSELCRMALAMHETSPIKDEIPLDVRSFISKVADLSTGGYGVVFVAEKEDGALCGMIAGEIMQLWFNPDYKVAQEVFWWVDKDHRGLLWRSLLNFLVSWATEEGGNKLSMRSSMFNDNMSKLERIYKKLGFISYDVFYIKELK